MILPSVILGKADNILPGSTSASGYWLLRIVPRACCGLRLLLLLLSINTLASALGLLTPLHCPVMALCWRLPCCNACVRRNYLKVVFLRSLRRLGPSSRGGSGRGRPFARVGSLRASPDCLLPCAVCPVMQLQNGVDFVLEQIFRVRFTVGLSWLRAQKISLGSHFVEIACELGWCQCFRWRSSPACMRDLMSTAVFTSLHIIPKCMIALPCRTFTHPIRHLPYSSFKVS